MHRAQIVARSVLNWLSVLIVYRRRVGERLLILLVRIEILIVWSERIRLKRLLGLLGLLRLLGGRNGGRQVLIRVKNFSRSR